jgi:hypothetical protein
MVPKFLDKKITAKLKEFEESLELTELQTAID